jgi:hypothetical protein
MKLAGRYTAETSYRDVAVKGATFRRAVFDSDVDLELTDDHFAIRSEEVLGDLIFTREELGRLGVGVVAGKLEMTIIDPKGARGHVTFQIEVPDPEAWVRALREAGAALLPS